MTKVTIGIIGAVVVAVLAISIVLQNQSIAKLREDNQALQQQMEQFSELQVENERLSNLVANAESSAVQDSPVRQLARLRAEVVTLRDNVTRLRQQTNNMSKLQNDLARLREENQQLHSGLETMAASKRTEPPATESVSAQNACINNLRLIDAAKQQWVLEQRKQASDIPVWSDLQPYLGRGPNGELPVCPSDGAYTIGAVSEKPQCNVAEHVLP